MSNGVHWSLDDRLDSLSDSDHAALMGMIDDFIDRRQPEACPFCGTDTPDLLKKRLVPNTRAGFVGCVHCGASGPVMATMEHAVQAWNRRAAKT